MFSNMPPVTKALLIANGLVFLLQMVLRRCDLHALHAVAAGDGGVDALGARGRPASCRGSC